MTLRFTAAISTQRFAGNFKTPTLVLHSEKDYRVPLTHGLEYYYTLRQKGVPTRQTLTQGSVRVDREVYWGWTDEVIG